MIHEYPSFTREYVLLDLPSVEGWAFYNWSLAADPWRNAELQSDGYIAQERDRLA